MENPKGRDHSEDLAVDGKVISERITGKQGGGVWTKCICLRTGPSGGCEDGHEPSGFIKGGEFLNKDSAPWS
jgi:hypothetical protein